MPRPRWSCCGCSRAGCATPTASGWSSRRWTRSGRVAWRLHELSERFGEATGDGIEVELPLSQEQLASWCGASREATVKALAALRTLGCISTGRRSVLIRDLEALGRHAQGAA